ncbi:MAG: hypothetical protein M3P04_14290 [Actinomycetota bacterium]|nr:hypothetical protein [Actinomycetota bacterium]
MRRRLPQDVRFCLFALLAGRVLVSVLAVVGWQLPHDVPEPATSWNPQAPSHALFAAFTGLEHYDAAWYLQLSSHGYHNGDPSSAFFPLYPMLTHVVGVLCGGRWLLGAYLVTHVSLFVALVLLYRLTTRELSESTARWTVVLLLVSPVAFFLYAPYSESLFLALSLACLTWLRQGRWGPAASAALLASATRSTGVVLGAAMAAQALSDVDWRPHVHHLRTLLPRLVLSTAGVLGTAGYLIYWAARDDWRAPLDAQSTAFQREPAWPWLSLVHGLKIAGETISYPGWLITNLEVALTLVGIGLGVVVVVRRFAAPYVAMTITSLVLPLTLARPFSPLTSVPRYYLVVFPMFWALAELTRRPAVRVLVLSLSGSLLVLLTLLFSSWHDVL